MNDLFFYTSYSLPFIVLYFYKNKGCPHVVQVNCTNFMMLNYLVVGHVGLLVLYLNPGGFAQLQSVDKNTVVLLSFYTNILILMCIGTGYTLPNSSGV